MNFGMTHWSDTYVGKLESAWKQSWPALRNAWATSQAKISDLMNLIGDTVPSECSAVVFGSLGRGEFTAQSDLDWVLLVDGRCSPQHRLAENEIRLRLAREMPPNPGGPFGGMVFSHEILHHIGGTADSNANFTRRMLLLLEGRELSTDLTNSAFDRVRRAVFERYFDEEFRAGTDPSFPRFLLNDMIRFWRTVAVDYAAKLSERGFEGGALRNVKLRFSRKLLYVAGLVLCSKCTKRPAQANGLIDLQNTSLCHSLVENSPLNLLAQTVEDWKLSEDASLPIFQNYDRFLEMTGQPEVRTHLKNLRAEDCNQSDAFLELRELGRNFESGLQNLLFSNNNPALDRIKHCILF